MEIVTLSGNEIHLFADVAQRMLYEAAMEQIDEFDRMMEEKAEKTVQLLREKSPKRKGKKGGKYARSWRVKKGERVYTVHNGKHYRLTHLLEKGTTSAKAYPHITPVYEQIKSEIENEIGG